jgi:hypothetical protein
VKVNGSPGKPEVGETDAVTTKFEIVTVTFPDAVPPFPSVTTTEATNVAVCE